MAITSSIDSTWFLFTLPTFITTQTLLSNPALLLFTLLTSILTITLLSWLLTPGGPAWSNARAHKGTKPIPGPRGLPIFGSLFTLAHHSLPHQVLARLASKNPSMRSLMAFSIGSTPAVVSSDPSIAREILSHPSFADRPLKQSARELMFGRAIGFAPSGAYWRLLRRIASTHLFSPKRISSHEFGRQGDCDALISSIADEQSSNGAVCIRKHLQNAAVNNIMGSVFGRRFDFSSVNYEAEELKEMVREGFELLGAFNWTDHLPWLSLFYDPCDVKRRCAALVPRVRKFVSDIIDEHRATLNARTDAVDFVDVLLSLEGEEKLDHDDMIAVLWEMIFRGTDTTALLTEWTMAELVLNQTIQSKLRHEITAILGPTASTITDVDVARIPYLQAVIKESLRLHPPGPLLSWARLSTSDVQLSNGMVVPAGTTTMVNMWSITHDPTVWPEPQAFKPERFLAVNGGVDVDVRGWDLRLAPFGAGRRVCPGKNLGLVTVGLWVARLVNAFEWTDVGGGVDVGEVLKLSLEMKTPLMAVAKNVGA